jgi:hypothetical protein
MRVYPETTARIKQIRALAWATYFDQGINQYQEVGVHHISNKKCDPPPPIVINGLSHKRQMFVHSLRPT